MIYIQIKMKGQVIQFRMSRHRVHPRHFLINVNAKDRKEADTYIGKIVEWKSSAGKVIKGKISGTHGNKGIVRAIFEKGLPGQAVMNSDEVEIK